MEIHIRKNKKIKNRSVLLDSSVSPLLRRVRFPGCVMLYHVIWSGNCSRRGCYCMACCVFPAWREEHHRFVLKSRCLEQHKHPVFFPLCLCEGSSAFRTEVRMRVFCFDTGMLTLSWNGTEVRSIREKFVGQRLICMICVPLYVVLL